MERFKDLPVLHFPSPKEWHTWLIDNQHQSSGVWLKHAKKSSGQKSVSYQEALEEALCFGWIDSQKQRYDDDYFLQKFTPRGPKSMWSRVNVTKVESLIKAGKMQPSGLDAVNAAKLDGRWEAAYDSPSTITVPEDFQAVLDKNPKAKQFFETLNKANIYAFCWRVQTTKKPETRMAKIAKFIDMLGRGQKFH